MRRKNGILGLIFLMGCLTGCGDSKPVKMAQQTWQVAREPIHNSLFFTGIIQPLRENGITSPVEGVVETMNYHYGEAVHKGDIIAVLNSETLQKQYNETLTDFLKAKDNYMVTKAKFTGTQNLWDSGLLSKNNYLSEKSSLNIARVGLAQASRKLTEMLDKIDNPDKETVSRLTMSEFNKVQQALSSKHNLVYLRAPANGVLLYPPKSAADKTLRLTLGSPLKAGQLFGLIGDLDGISIEIEIPEVDISKIHPGMSASITGVALGQEVLFGKLIAVNAQASGSSNTLPAFNALVQVEKLTDKERALIKVGMSASVELILDEDKQLRVPIAALKQENGVSVVSIKSSNGDIQSRKVVTGAVDEGKVVIKAGLKEGDLLVL